MDPIDHIEECIMVDTMGLKVPGVDVTPLPRKFMEFEGPESSKYAKGNLVTEGGKVSLKVKGIKSTKTMYLDGSPGFHFQGHNVVTSGDATMLAFAAVREAKNEWSLNFSPAKALEFANGHGIEVTRIDTPVLLKMPDGLPKKAVMNALALAGILAGHNTSVYIGESVYFDQSSQLEALKIYDKLAQVMAARRSELPVGDSGDALRKLVEFTIRMEPVYRQKFLLRAFDGKLPEPQQLHARALAAMLMDLLDKYTLKRRLRQPLNQEQLMGITVPRFRAVAEYWQRGYDVLKMLNGNTSEYSRAKGYLLKNHTLDIDDPPPAEIDSEIELGDILSPKNFLPVPPELRADRDVFFDLDMDAVRDHIGTLISSGAAR